MKAPGRRPGFHVTAPAGWINDPLGVTWHQDRSGEQGRYELFVQYVPEGTDWAPACHWGQLRSRDLVDWEWIGTALSPGPDEDGCWSGSVVIDDGVPVIVYTSVVAPDLGAGRIALAFGDVDWRRWAGSPPVLTGPPPELGLTHFRDPFLWREGEGWRMVVGGGRDDGAGLALLYTSGDLRRWAFDGVLAEGPAGPAGAPWLGSVWECVQFFPLDGAWVLLISVWDDGQPRRTAAAVGEYDGVRFTARAWQRFTATDAAYATTVFLDADGRRCALSWVHEPGTTGTAWAGVLSAPLVLALDGDRIVTTPHPALAAARTGTLAALEPASLDAAPLSLGPFDPFLDVTLTVPAGGEPVRLAVATDGTDLLVVRVDPDAVSLFRPGRPDERIPTRAAAGDDRVVRLLLDADLAEVFTAGDAGAVRIDPAPGQVSLQLSGSGARLSGLTVSGMPSP